MDRKKISQPNKTNIWFDTLSGYPDAAESDYNANDKDAREYVLIESIRKPGSCGAFYEVDFLKSLHSSKTICTVVKTTWKYLNDSGSSTKKVCVLPKDEEALGCTGWQNPTGADTTYKREILSAWYK